VTPQSTLALYIWLPISIYLFFKYPAQRAAMLGFIGAWMFLPQGYISISPLPDYDRMAAACYGIFVGAMIFDAPRLTTFRPSWIDIPIILFCLSLPVTQVANGISPISPTFNQIVVWGAPYFVGRLYFNNLDGLRKLAIGIVIGGLIYIPFCLVEGVMGPLLHEKVYGYNAFDDWSQARRFGGWRPVVFMNHGLMTAMWMLTATLTGLWLWKTKVIKKIKGKPFKPLVFFLLLVFINCRSTGAWVLLLFGWLVLVACSFLKTNFPMLLLVAIAIFYLSVAVTGSATAEQLTDPLRAIFPEDRIASVYFRLINEEILGEHARNKMLLGWGASGGNRVGDAVTDSLWIIVFGVQGVVGIITWAAALLLPVIRFCARYPASSWKHPKVAPAAVLAVCLNLYFIDCLLNAMINPVFTLVAGGLSGLAIKPTENYQARGSPVKKSVPAAATGTRRSRRPVGRGRRR